MGLGAAPTLQSVAQDGGRKREWAEARGHCFDFASLYGRQQFILQRKLVLLKYVEKLPEGNWSQGRAETAQGGMEERLPASSPGTPTRASRQ